MYILNIHLKPKTKKNTISREFYSGKNDNTNSN